MTDEPKSPPQPKTGALQPMGAWLQVGERPDKPCVQAALLILEAHELSFATAQLAIDAYVDEAKKRNLILEDDSRFRWLVQHRARETPA